MVLLVRVVFVSLSHFPSVVMQVLTALATLLVVTDVKVYAVFAVHCSYTPKQYDVIHSAW
jgi:hypothetical protein